MKIKLSKPKGKTKKMAKGEWRYQVILILTLIIMMYPIVYMIGTSFKTLQDIFSSGLNVFTSNPTMANYIQVFKSNDILILLKNSLIIALIVTVSKIVTSVLASYCLCFMDLKHPEVIFGLFTISMFIPLSVIMIPNYLTLSRIGLNNTLIGVALPQLADAMGIYRIRQSMRSIPKPLIEVARLDNVGHLTILRRIVLPLVNPAVIAMIIFFFINSWNEYVWPMLILKRQENYTITLALQTFMDSESGSAWGSSMALATIATLVPMVLYIFAQRKIIGTFMQSGVIVGDKSVPIPEEWKSLIGNRSQVKFGIRPEHVKLMKVPEGPSVNINYVENQGDKKSIAFLIEDNIFMATTDTSFEEQETMYLAMDWNKMHLFDVDTTENIGYPENRRR